MLCGEYPLVRRNIYGNRTADSESAAKAWRVGRAGIRMPEQWSEHQERVLRERRQRANIHVAVSSYEECTELHQR